MNIGEHYISKAYYGTHEITMLPSGYAAYAGVEPLIEHAYPDIWLPFENDLNLSQSGSKITTLPANTDNNFVRWDSGMALQNDGGAKVTVVGSGTKGTLITNWNVPYEIFPSQRTVNDVTYGPASVTLSTWVKIDLSEITSATVGGRTGTINGSILGHVDSYQFYGLMFVWDIDNRVLKAWCRNRKGGFGEDVTMDLGVIPTNTWVHLACTLNIQTNRVTAYVNGEKKSADTSVRGVGVWEWCFQCYNVIMSGSNGRAVRLPFVYKDVRIYGRCLSKDAIAYLYSLHAPT